MTAIDLLLPLAVLGWVVSAVLWIALRGASAQVHFLTAARLIEAVARADARDLLTPPTECIDADGNTSVQAQAVGGWYLVRDVGKDGWTEVEWHPEGSGE